MFRKIIFWTHLLSGVLTGLVILTMSFTGVVLTYERQIKNRLEQADYLPVSQQGEPLPLEQLAQIARQEVADFEPSTATLLNHPGAPVTFAAGRRGPSVELNPYTGEAMEVGSAAVEEFFSSMTGFHRWFNVSGENRDIARAITGASNLIFLFLILSGMYLWLPRIWKWAAFKARLFFYARPPTAKARDFNWHHVFGFWSAVPLAVVVATGSVFSYGWASDLVYIVMGEQPPGSERESAVATRAGGQNELLASVNPPQMNFLPLAQLADAAADYLEQWQSLSISLPEGISRTVEISVDQGNGAQPHLRHTLTIERSSGALVNHQPFTQETPGRQARSFVRFLHTGEVYGLVGQTIAGLVSLTSLFMVWTGFALAYRRLLQPLWRSARRPQR